MAAKIIQKEMDAKTGIPFTIQRTGLLLNEDGNCIEVYYKKLRNFLDGSTEIIKGEMQNGWHRIIIQDVEAIPAHKEGAGLEEVDVSEIPASTHYTDYCAQFHKDDIDSAIDNHLEQM